jgi:16S rRNA (guanine527-N7)-methyltransferase
LARVGTNADNIRVPAGLVHRIERRLIRAGVAAPSAISPALTTYLELLAKWNRRINLTAFDLDDPSDEALDRLLVEPVVMARFVRPTDAVTIDVGSGGGSPALPFRLVAPTLRQVLVESKSRKAAFLREVIRHLALDRVEVENRRLEDLPSTFRGRADIVTMRAVRADATVLKAVASLMGPRGRFFWLTTERARHGAHPGFDVSAVESLLPAGSSDLAILSIHAND